MARDIAMSQMSQHEGTWRTQASWPKSGHTWHTQRCHCRDRMASMLHGQMHSIDVHLPCTLCSELVRSWIIGDIARHCRCAYW